MRADLVVLEGDPASDVRNFARVRYRKVLAHLGVMPGLVVGAVGPLAARDWDDSWGGRDYQRQDLRHDYRTSAAITRE
jgi:hypothetical protein